MAQQATASNFNNDLSIKTVYSKGTYNTLKLLIKYLKKEDKNPENVTYSSFERAARFTGLPKDRLMNIMTEKQSKSEIVKTIDRKTIHYILTDFYMRERTYPTCVQLFDRLQGNIPFHVNIQTFRDTLVEMGYMFKKKGDMTVVIESPKARFERYMYLKNIKRNRELKKDIYFVGEFAILDYNMVLNLEESMKTKSQPLFKYICAVSAETGKFFSETVASFTENGFKQFISCILLSHIDRPSVIIYDYSTHHNETYCPQLESLENSLKDEIIEWLHYHEISCDTNMSKFQLWNLVQNFTDTNANTYVVDTLIKHHGHEVLRLPDSINDLTLVAGARQCINKNVKEPFQRAIKNNNLTTSYNLDLIAEESNILDLELEIDEVLDDLGDPFIDPLSDTTVSGSDLELPCINDVF